MSMRMNVKNTGLHAMPRHNRLCAALLILAFGLMAPMSAQMTAQAQITFSEKTAELEALEASVNDCAARQVISACYAALSRTHVLQNSYVDSEDSADRIMRNAVMLLPLYMLAELYNRDGRQDVSCGYALSGERQLHRLLRDLDRLLTKDPAAFKNIDKTQRGLQDFQARFDKALARCE